jgi:transcriptional regulator with XRE-family HTH domain
MRAVVAEILGPRPPVDYLAGNGNTAIIRAMLAPMISSVPVGNLLREWRQRRRMSQLDLALEAEISARHLSFIETGRSQPSREMVLNLSERLDVPLRDRNVLLVAAGYAPVFPEKTLDDPALAAARRAVDMVLKGHEPFPALAVDRHWTLIASNAAVPSLLTGADPSLLRPPVNVLRLSLHPDGLAPRIANLAEWRAHLLARLRRQIEISADKVLVELLDELAALPAPFSKRPIALSDHELAGIVVPFRLVTDGGILCFISTTTVFGTPVDITLSELALEAFFPADTATAEALRRLAA